MIRASDRTIPGLGPAPAPRLPDQEASSWVAAGVAGGIEDGSEDWDTPHATPSLQPNSSLASHRGGKPPADPLGSALLALWQNC